MPESSSAELSWPSRALLLACAVAVYGVHFWPSPYLRDAALAWLDYPEFAGFKGMFLPHLLLYSTLTALCAAIVWFVLVANRLLPPPLLDSFSRRQFGLGVLGGLVALAATLLFVYLIFPSGSLRWMDPVGWKIAGNVFSNFYEEFLYRGFFVVALTAALGFWPAAVLSSAMWAYTHTQYPMSLQLLIAGTGVFWCWLARKARSLWAPYTSHMVLDVVADSLIG
ncbi:MAG TPA: type II CAAX endopeptidase family protein [Sphingomicrobium sp.]|nr:type II CAAX endopeptidase family protein [Sphingomicrobium sp.]